MSIFPIHGLDGLFREYGYGAIFTGVLLESIGLPLPGKSLMIAAAIDAATTHHLDIFLLVLLAASGAICGDLVTGGAAILVSFKFVERNEKRLMEARRQEMKRDAR